MKLKFLAILLVLPVLISACIGGGKEDGETSVSPNEGLVIKEFSATPTNLYEDEEGQLSLTVLNKGGVPASNPVAFVFNSRFDNFEVKEGKTRTGAGSTTPSSAAGAVKMLWTDFGASIFYGPDPQNKRKAFPESYEWVITPQAGLAQEGLPVPYNPRARVCYDYLTTATTKFLAISLEEQRLEQQRDAYTESDITTKNSGAPVHVEIDSRQPVIFRTTSTVSGSTPANSKELRLNVKVTNVNPAAGGIAYLRSSSDGFASCVNPKSGKENAVLVMMRVPGAISDRNFTMNEAGKNVTFTDPDTGRNVTFVLSGEQFNVLWTNIFGTAPTAGQIKVCYPQGSTPVAGAYDICGTDTAFDVVGLADGRTGSEVFKFIVTQDSPRAEFNVLSNAFYSYYSEAQTNFNVVKLAQ